MLNLEKLKAATEKMESYPKMVFDPIRHDVRTYMEEQSPNLCQSIGQIAVKRLSDGTGYGGVFLASLKPYWYVMTGKGFKFKPADNEDNAHTLLQDMLSSEQTLSKLVRQRESSSDMDKLFFNLSNVQKAGHVAYTRHLKSGKVVYVQAKLGATKQKLKEQISERKTKRTVETKKKRKKQERIKEQNRKKKEKDQADTENAKWAIRMRMTERKVKNQEKKEESKKTPKPKKAPRPMSQSEVQRKIGVMRRKLEREDDKRINEHDSRQKAAKEVATKLESDQKVTGWSTQDGGSIQIVRHPKDKKDKNWYVLRWSDQSIEPFKEPEKAAARFVELVGIAEAKKVLTKSLRLVFKAKKVPCGKCGRTDYNDIRGRCCDRCAFPEKKFKKAIPTANKEAPAKQAPKPIAAGEKKQGVGPKGKVRYNYPTEKGKPGAAPRVGDDEPKVVSKPPEQNQQAKPTPQEDPQEHAYVDPAKLAALLQISVGVLKKIALKFQRNPKKDAQGRKGFVNFMVSQLKKLNDKHDLDPKYFGLVYDALVGAAPQPKPVVKKDQNQ